MGILSLSGEDISAADIWIVVTPCNLRVKTVRYQKIVLTSMSLTCRNHPAFPVIEEQFLHLIRIPRGYLKLPRCLCISWLANECDSCASHEFLRKLSFIRWCGVSGGVGFQRWQWSEMSVMRKSLCFVVSVHTEHSVTANLTSLFLSLHQITAFVIQLGIDRDNLWKIIIE